MTPRTRPTVKKDKRILAKDQNSFSPLSSGPRPRLFLFSTRNALSPSRPLLSRLGLLSKAISIPNIISSRVKSYINWPYKHLSTVKLAAAGFYHVVDAEEDDAVRCDHCDK